MRAEKTKIKLRYIVLCEGRDAYNFICWYLNSDALKFNERFANDIQAIDFEGVEQLEQSIATLKKMENYLDVNRMLIFRDAETDVQKAEHMVQTALRKNDLPVPEHSNEWIGEEDKLKVAYTLLPSCNECPVAGTLEDLCWKILKNGNAPSIRNDVQKFIDRVKSQYGLLSTYEHKGRLHTYFSINDKFVSMKVGEAAKAGAFDWSHPALDPLKNLIAEGFK